MRQPGNRARSLRQGQRPVPVQGGLRRPALRPVHKRLLRLPALPALQLQQERLDLDQLRHERQVLLPVELRRPDLQPVRPRLLQLPRVHECVFSLCPAEGEFPPVEKLLTNEPSLSGCNCETSGSIGVSCDSEGKCQCRENFDGDRCEKCKENFYNFPICEGCNCDPAGIDGTFQGCGSLPAGELCQCKERVEGRICNKCKKLFWNLQSYNPDGCEGDCLLSFRRRVKWSVKTNASSFQTASATFPESSVESASATARPGSACASRR